MYDNYSEGRQGIEEEIEAIRDTIKRLRNFKKHELDLLYDSIRILSFACERIKTLREIQCLTTEVRNEPKNTLRKEME